MRSPIGALERKTGEELERKQLLSYETFSNKDGWRN